VTVTPSIHPAVLNVGSSVSFNGTGYMELPRWLVRYDQLHQEDAVIALGVQTRGDGVLFYQGELAEPDRGDYVLIRGSSSDITDVSFFISSHRYRYAQTYV